MCALPHDTFSWESVMVLPGVPSLLVKGISPDLSYIYIMVFPYMGA